MDKPIDKCNWVEKYITLACDGFLRFAYVKWAVRDLDNVEHDVSDLLRCLYG